VNIDDYEGLYKFDRSLNQVYNIKTKKYITNRLKKGNYSVRLSKDGERKEITLNYLIYKYNQDNNQEDLMDIDGYENYKFDKNKNQVINIKSGKYIKNELTKEGYYRVGLIKNGKKKHLFLHRLVFKSHNPLINIEGFNIDHINQNKLDNNIDNLRVATISENNCNIKVRNNNKSTGIKNISKTKNNTFRVSIMKDRKSNSKTFKTLEEATEWRDIKLKEIHKEFACY